MDLQYIRINATLVGGIVGLLIFTLSRALGGQKAADRSKGRRV
jgi:hypothetical protein